MHGMMIMSNNRGIDKGTDT